MFKTEAAMKVFFPLIATLFATLAFAQNGPSLPAYKRYPTVPALQLLTLDSTVYTKENLPAKKPLLLMLFSPDCEHCQHKAEQIVANKEAFQDTHILMVSNFALPRLQSFATTYGLDQFQNVTVTKDPFYLLVAFYEIRMLPYAALYNRKGNLIRTFEGNVSVDRIISAFEENQ